MKGLLTVAICQAANKMKGATKGEKTTNDYIVSRYLGYYKINFGQLT